MKREKVKNLKKSGPKAAPARNQNGNAPQIAEKVALDLGRKNDLGRGHGGGPVQGGEKDQSQILGHETGQDPGRGLADDQNHPEDALNPGPERGLNLEQGKKGGQGHRKNQHPLNPEAPPSQLLL